MDFPDIVIWAFANAERIIYVFLAVACMFAISGIRAFIEKRKKK